MGRQLWYIEKSVKRSAGVAYVMSIGGSYNEAILAFHYAKNLSLQVQEPLSHAHLEYMLRLIRSYDAKDSLELKRLQ